MLNIKIITVGRLKEKYLRDACSEYLKRLKRFGNGIGRIPSFG